MSRFQEYLNGEALQSMTYEEYCANVDYVFSIDEGIWDSVKSTIKDVKMGFLAGFREELARLTVDLKITWENIVHALKQKDVFHFFKALGFSIGTLTKSLHNLGELFRSGLTRVFKEIHDNKYVQKIHNGAMKVDELLDMHPMLKKLTGPLVAALLFWCWLNMTFIGHADFDFDLSHIGKALKGQYALADVFTSPEGLLMIGLVSTGSLISMPWLGRATYNVLAALLYTAFKKVKDTALANKVKDHLVLKPIGA